MSNVYEINKGVNRSLEFKGFKAQYVIFLAIGMLALLILFAILYIIGIPVFLSLSVIATSGFILVRKIGSFSRTYGQHGLMKREAGKRVPDAITCRTRKVFTILRKH